MLIMLAVITMFIILGIVFIRGKGAFLIAGFNTMPKEEKEKYDIVSLCKFMGKMMFALAFSMLFWVLSDMTHINGFFVFGIILFIGITIFMLVYMNTNNRFKK